MLNIFVAKITGFKHFRIKNSGSTSIFWEKSIYFFTGNKHGGSKSEGSCLKLQDYYNSYYSKI